MKCSLGICNFLEQHQKGFSGGISGKEPTYQCITDADLIPGSGRCPGEGQVSALQCSFLENPMDRGACWATVHRAVTSQTRLSDLTQHTAPKMDRIDNSGQRLETFQFRGSEANDWDQVWTPAITSCHSVSLSKLLNISQTLSQLSQIQTPFPISMAGVQLLAPGHKMLKQSSAGVQPPS